MTASAILSVLFLFPIVRRGGRGGGGGVARAERETCQGSRGQENARHLAQDAGPLPSEEGTSYNSLRNFT